MHKPLVVIVGRPNVGKSTLFNRLVGKLDAIVDNVSGVTRDRNYGEAEWCGKHFRLIDTGGYVPNSDDLFETAIREQIQIAIDEADVIIFLVDGRLGPNPFDFEIASLLRQSGKKVVLTVNKIDSEKQAMLAAEFHVLGIGDVVPVSAMTGRTTGDFLDIVTEGFLQGEDEDEEKQIKIAVVGRPNVGKSSLTNALLGFERSIVTNIPGTTRDSLDSTLKYYGKEIVLIDTAGLRRKSKIKEQIEYFSSVRSLKAIAESTVSVVLIDAKLGLDNQDQKIIDEAVQRRKGLIIGVNKWDLIEKETNTAKEFEEKLRDKLGGIDYVPIIFISALTKQRIFKLIELAIQVHEERGKKISNEELNDTLLPETERTPPPASPSGKEVKIKYITQKGSHYPVFLFFANHPTYIPDAYRRFLEKRIRHHFGFTGVPFTLSFKQK